MDELSIPVLVDDRKDAGDFRMTRAAYYYVEAVEPERIPIDHSELGIPVLPLRSSAVIFRPEGGGDRFTSADQIEALFRAVEKRKGYYVDSDSIWIPNDLFERPPARAEIFRVPLDLFLDIYFRSHGSGVPAWEESPYGDRHGSVRFSEVETGAYREWADRILREVIDEYPKNESLKLSTK